MITILVASVILAYGTIKAAKFLHQHLLYSIFGAPQAFFDTVPMGRILARFSTDLRTVDDTLPQNFQQFLSTFFRVGFIFFLFFFVLSINIGYNKQC